MKTHRSNGQCRCRACAITKCTLCALFVLCAAPPASAETLDGAYRTELTRLQAEQTSMATALRRAKADGEKESLKLAKEIESLARTLTRLRTDNAKKEMQLPEAERLHSMQEQERIIERRERQIETWLETHGVPLPPDARGEADKEGHQHPPLAPMVEAALNHVEEHGQLWVRSDQEYFGADGVAAMGSVLRIAEVGAIAIDDDSLDPLELAADGSLRVTEQLNSPPVPHGNSRTVSVMLFDPDDIRPSRPEAGGWRDWIERGGAVMWAIASLAALAFLVFLERIFMFAIYLLRLRTAERNGPSVAVGKDNELLRPIALIQTGLGNPEELETEAAEAIIALQPFVRRGISLLAVVASVAPLLGLLGTVTGMIGTFGMITEHGTGDPRLLSGGISEALLTTQFGLMVAIPALLLQTTLHRSGDAILRRVERFALAALDVRIAETDIDRVSDGVVTAQSTS